MVALYVQHGGKGVDGFTRGLTVNVMDVLYTQHEG